MKKPTRHIPVVHQDPQGEWYAVCTCGQNSGPNHFPKVQRWMAEDWVRQHNEQVQHALAVLHRANGSIKIERDHAAKMLADPNVSAHDKELWQILFEGAERRLRDDGAPQAADEGMGLW